jgi:hypothetical protein
MRADWLVRVNRHIFVPSSILWVLLRDGVLGFGGAKMDERGILSLG